MEETFDVPPMRVSAFVALALGVLSVFSVFAAVMCVFAVAAGVFGLIALRPSRAPFGGRRVAVTGLALAACFGSWGYASYQTTKKSKIERATWFATEWLDSFRLGFPEMTYELTLRDELRRVGKMNLREFYRKPEALMEDEEMEGGYPLFLKGEFYTTIVNCESDPKWECVDDIQIQRRFGQEQIYIRFRDATGQIDRDVKISMERAPAINGNRVDWRVETFELD